jgi:hypothetical protein
MALIALRRMNIVVACIAIGSLVHTCEGFSSGIAAHAGLASRAAHKGTLLPARPRFTPPHRGHMRPLSPGSSGGGALPWWAGDAARGQNGRGAASHNPRAPAGVAGYGQALGADVRP